MKTHFFKHFASLTHVLYLFFAVIAISISAIQTGLAQTGKPNIFSAPASVQPSQSIFSIEEDDENREEPAVENENFPGQELSVAPQNDNYSAALDTVNILKPKKNYKYGTMATATLEPGEYTGCFTPVPDHTVWYSFVAVKKIMNVIVKPSNLACSSSFGIAVYEATPNLPTVPIACLNYFPATSTNLLSKLEVSGLHIGSTYAIQVAFHNNVNCNLNVYSPFAIKIRTTGQCSTCANICGPLCVMAGPSWGSCCNNAQVNQIMATGPSYDLKPPMNNFDIQTRCYSFVPPNDTIRLQLIPVSYCNPNSLMFTFTLYDSSCTFIQSGNVFAGDFITNLSVGQTYKICYTLQSQCSWDSLTWPFAYTNLPPAPERISLETPGVYIAPNPVQDDLTLSYSFLENTGGIFELSDMNGKIILRKALPELSTLQKINVSGFSPGIYFFTVKNSGGAVFHGKVVKE